MTADKTASGEPGALECAMSGNCFQGVLRARRSKAAARRQRWGNAPLVPADEQSKGAPRQLEKVHVSPGAENSFPPAEELFLQCVEAGGVGFPTGFDHQVPRGLSLLNFAPPDVPQAAPQTIAGHRGGLEFGNYQSHPWLARWIVDPDHVEVLEPAAPAMGEAAANVGRAHEPMGSRQARRTRQEPPCFDGIETVSCLRPFLRRRERTARPQRVAMRARNPCLLILRLLRGR